MFPKHFRSRLTEGKKKKMCKIFKENGLNIAVECNSAITNFLDVTFDLKSATYYLYRKQNNEISYIHKQLKAKLYMISYIHKQLKAKLYMHAQYEKCDSKT